jgi:hypothetical protein
MKKLAKKVRRLGNPRLAAEAVRAASGGIQIKSGIKAGPAYQKIEGTW